MKRKFSNRALALGSRLLLLAAFWLSGVTQLFAALEVGRLRTEAMKNPVGIDVIKPSFSWCIENTTERGVMQTAYEINVYADAQHTQRVWSSGKVESDACVDIPYAGDALKASTRYYWNVTVWDNKSNETTSGEEAFFETGLLDGDWHGAQWIQATKTTVQEVESDVRKYSVETDFEIENLAAGVIFAAKDDRNYFMWQVNMEAGYPRFRPHGWQNGTATCFAETDLRPLISIELHKTYHLSIVVDGDKAETYIDGILIDTRTNPYGGNYGYGQIGIRQDRALNNYNDLESAFYDNFKVTDLTDGTEEILINETFSGDTNPFGAGSIQDGRLYVQTAYAWFVQQEDQDIYDLEMDFLIERDNAGIMFSAYDVNNMHMWGINIQGQSPILRHHLRVNGGFTTSDVNLGEFFTKAEMTQTLHHLKIAVRQGGKILTYIDDKLVDTYTDTSGRLHNGLIGFRAFRDNNMNELACYDNIKITTYATADASDEGEVTFFEDFEDAGHDFTEGVVTVKADSHMLTLSTPWDETCTILRSEDGVPVFRKVFATSGQIKSAKLYATAMGVFDLFVNGNRVGQPMSDGSMRYDELKPGWTDYRKEVSYMAYDVTALLREGENAFGAQVSNGWWGGAIARGVYGATTPGFIAQLRLEYEDGHVEYIVTDTDWHSAFCGPLMYGDIYNGETYDARRECDWSTPEYNADNWYKTEVFNGFNGKIIALDGPAVRVREHLHRTPETITVYDGVTASGSAYGMVHVDRVQPGTEKLILKAGETALFDMAQNMVGWVRFTAKGERGTRLRFRFGEMLNDKGDTNRADDGPGGSLYTYNLRTADATLHYTMKGGEAETFQPSSSFFGFRYCEVTASHDVEILSLTGEVVGSDIEESATFETSDQDVNRLYSNIIWGQRGNFLSIPTDCPQRDERLGWTGDTQIFARTANYNSDARAFYRKWMRDLRNGQRYDGAYPDIAPYCNFWGFGTAGWGDAGVIVPWSIYLMTGDKQILEENYESITQYMKFLEAQTFDGYLYNGAGTTTGDWLAYETTDSRYVSVCWYAYIAQLMSKISDALSENEADFYHAEAEKYRTLFENIREEYQKRYLDSDGYPRISTQTSYLMALNFDLLPEEIRSKALSRLLTKISSNGYKLSTGFVGTGMLNQTLSRLGANDMAYNLLQQRENPSWLYSVDQGATTVWERWDSYTLDEGFNKHPWIMNSFNHYAYGVVAEWMYRYVSGIEADETMPGFKHIILQPTPDMRRRFPTGQRITNAKATFRSTHGLISSEWDYKEDKRIAYKATIPANTTATLYLPVVKSDDNITVDGKPVEEIEGVTLKGVENGKAVIELVSGTYEFNVEENVPDHVDETTVSGIKVYPSPFHDRLFVECNDDIVRMTVTGCAGQTIYSQTHNAPVDTSSWSAGIYVVNVSTAYHQYTAKVIKQ